METLNDRLRVVLDRMQGGSAPSRLEISNICTDVTQILDPVMHEDLDTLIDNDLIARINDLVAIQQKQNLEDDIAFMNHLASQMGC